MSTWESAAGNAAGGARLLSDAESGGNVRRVVGFDRRELLLLVASVVTANAIWNLVSQAVIQNGWFGAVVNSFGISIIVWAALWLGIEFLHRSASRDCLPLDGWLAACVLAFCLLPIAGATWVVLAAFGLYVIVTSGTDEQLRRGGWILLTLTVPMFWGRRLFNFFSDVILSADAFLVSLATGTERLGNTVSMPGGEGILVISAPCSSMANVSLAVLCWTLFTQYHGVRWTPRNVLWCAAACLSVVAINVSRITVIGYFPHYYAFLHDGGGVTIFSWLTALASFAVCAVGMHHVGKRAA